MLPFNTQASKIDTDEEGKLVRTPDGTRRWYQDGLLHRKSGPAFESIDGTKMWFSKGQIHREDGPAIIQPDGREEFWLGGKQIEKKEFEAALKRQAAEKRAAERAEEQRKQRTVDEKHEQAANDTHETLRRAARKAPKIGKPPQP